MAEKLPVRDALLSFAAREPLRAALFLTYSFDGRWFEEAIIPDLCDRPIETMLVIRDRNAITSEAPSVRYRKINACASAVFHPKLALLVSDDSARAVISSANLSRGGFERQRELGRVFDLGPTVGTDYSLFESLAGYLQDGVATEVRGSAARDLTETTSALREVVKKCESPPSESSHTLLHNYVEPIWTQVLDKLPHRVLRRASIVSPFFEPDRRRPEDPALGPQDASIFARFLTEDFEFDPPQNELPTRVLFRQSEGRTELPVHKLSSFQDKVAFFAQDEREQRLHAKLVLLEGAEGNGREPFLVALHGSPNFTTAGLLHRPPHGNAELAVLTMLPPKRGSFDQVVCLLGLEQGFTQVEDLTALQSESGGEPPRPASQGAADVTYRVATQEMTISLLNPAPIGARVRVMLNRDGTWVAIGEADASEMADLVIPVTGMAEVDGQTNLLELRGTTVRVEVIGADGGLLSSDTAPVNVDLPEEFCGLTLVGAAILTLDERIARAGAGVPPTYREQQKWLETRRTQQSTSDSQTVTGHQADLDRFYRNIHQGLRGILTRINANPSSEFSVRRSLDELTRWAIEATTSDVVVMTRECRLFLIERLLRSVRVVTDRASPALKLRLPAIAGELCIADRLARVIEWLDGIEGSTLGSYAVHSRAHAQGLLNTLGSGATQ